MAKRKPRDDAFSTDAARRLLDDYWCEVGMQAEAAPDHEFLEDGQLRSAVQSSINHAQVGYRFCLPVQLLGKVVNPSLDALALQRGSASKQVGTWDARSLASKVVAPFNLAQEAVLGTSADPYVGNAFRVPYMVRDDPSKKDPAGWNVLIDVLEDVQQRGDPAYTAAVFRQVLLEVYRRQAKLRFNYPLPSRVSLDSSLKLSKQFVVERSGGDRPLALAGALFDVIGERFGLYANVQRARINASDYASGQAADLECVDSSGHVLLAVEVKDRALTLADVEGTISKARLRDIAEILFAVPRASPAEEDAIQRRVATAFASGQNLYCTDFFDLAKVVLALVGNAGRIAFLRRVGEHLDTWNTQPSHRKAWKSLLESL